MLVARPENPGQAQVHRLHRDLRGLQAAGMAHHVPVGEITADEAVFAGCGFAGAILGFGAVSLTIAAMTTPVGWAATGALLLGTTAAGATVGGGIGAAVYELIED